MNVATKRREGSAVRPVSKQRLRLWLRLLRAARGIEVELRERLRKQVSNGNVTGIIDRLAADKLVLRQAPANDRRSYIVRLTPKGAAQFAVVAKAHEGWIDELLSGFDAAQAEDLIHQLGGLATGIRSGDKQP